VLVRLDCIGRLEMAVKYSLLGIAAFIVVAACMAGDGPSLMRSIVAVKSCMVLFITCCDKVTGARWGKPICFSPGTGWFDKRRRVGS